MFVRSGALAAVLLAGSVATAQECPIPAEANPRLQGTPSELRLQYLHDALLHDGLNAVRWRWYWTGSLVISASALLGTSQLLHESQRVDFYVAGAALAFEILPLQILPLKVGLDGPAFDAKVRAAAASETCALIQMGEKLLLRDAADEAVNEGWIAQVSNVAYNLIVAAILGFGFHQWVPAAVSGIGGLIINEANIFTQPARLPELWKLYQAGQLTTPAPPPVSVRPLPAGVGVSGTF
jgi:hypothetical protein